MVEVVAGARIHVSLADMGYVTQRSFGGVGFMIESPKVRVRVQSNASVEWSGLGTLDVSAQADCQSLVNMVTKEHGRGARITIVEHPPQHVGLGSKTALRLSLISALHAEFGIESSRAYEQRISGRGGGSGVGIHGFYEGGLIWDGGHPRDSTKKLLPSGSAKPHDIPPEMLRLRFPDRWRVGLCLPSGKRIAGEAERKFFERVTPVSADDTLRAMAALYHGVLPAFQLLDLESLRVALAEVNSTGFKAKEISVHGESVNTLLNALVSRKYASGMSSLGPLVYAIYDKDLMNAEEDIEELCRDNDAKWLGVVQGLNRGASLTKDA